MRSKKLLSIFTIIFTLLAPSVGVFANEAQTENGTKAVTDFQDVLRTHNQYVAISYLQQNKVIKGYADGTFKPDNPINRAEVLKIILQGSKIEAPQEFNLDFPDVPKDAWFGPFVAKAKELGIVSGDKATGNFSGARQVNKAEFLKMLLLANKIKKEALQVADDVSTDVPKDAWFAPYLSYGLKSGIISLDQKGMANPNKSLTRAEVAEIMYLLLIIRNSSDTQFLLDRARSELAQIEVYIAANKVANAKRASELAVDLTQQAIRNLPEDPNVLGAGKLARAYDWLVDSFILGIQKKNEEAANMANKAIQKATEAWEVNNKTQPIARHIKDRAREILQQVGGTEAQPE